MKTAAEVGAVSAGVAVIGIGFVALLLVMAVPIMFLYAWALRILWGWFIVPTFALPMLGYAQAMGLTLTLGMFRAPTHEPKEKENNGKWLIGALIKPFMAVGIGWLIKYFGGL